MSPARDRETARKYGEGLPAFRDQAQAEATLFKYRDDRLAQLEKAALAENMAELDFSVASLRDLEGWYFDLFEGEGFTSIGIDRPQFEKCMAIYFGECAVRHAQAKWIVEEFPFLAGHYEIGVRKEGITMMLMGFHDHFRTRDNTRRQSLNRGYKKYFG